MKRSWSIPLCLSTEQTFPDTHVCNTIHCRRTFASAWMAGLSFFSVTDFNVGRSFSSLLRLFRCSVGLLLALSVRISDEEKKLTQIFIFKLLCGASEGFMKALKGFVEPFEVSQRCMKIKFQLIGCSMLVGRRPLTLLSSVCLSVCPSVCSSVLPSLSFLKIGSLFFWYYTWW